jgi:hypothetical protein
MGMGKDGCGFGYTHTLPNGRFNELHIARFFEKFKNHVLKFQKIMKKDLDVARDVFYKCVKISMQKTLYFGLHKNDKSADLV